MFSNPVRPSSLVDEGTVVQVDIIRCFCKVRTLSGQTLHSVQWLMPSGGSTRGADRISPMVGDRVMLNHGLGYPVIIGFFPRLQTEDGATPLKLSSGEVLVDTGNYSPEGTISWGDQNKPKDFLLGDRVISSIGGAILGLLRGGTVILRASRGAELVASKLANLVRIVSRNWEHFTEVSTDVVKNYKGRVYRYIGYAPTFLLAKIEDYKLHFYYGDTKAAETVKTNYHTYTGTPATNTIVYKEQITDTVSNAPRELMRRTIEINGNEEVWITNGTVFTRVTSTPLKLTFSWNDQNTISIEEANIHAVHKDGADLIMDAAGIRATFMDGNINMSAGSIVTTKGGSIITSTNGEITMLNSTGSALVSPAITRIVNGSHAVSVTASGVNIT